MPLTKLLYCSEHRYDFPEPSAVEQINKTVLISQQNNLARSITGVLLAESSSFVQILEGEREDILKLFHKIKQDARHFNVLLLSVQNIAERNFAAWQMGCVQKTRLNAHLFEPFIETNVFRPDRYKSSGIYWLLGHLSAHGLNTKFEPAIEGQRQGSQQLYNVPVDVCDSACNTRLFESEDAAAKFIAALRRFYPASHFPYVILPDPNGSSQFLVKIMVADAEMLNCQKASADPLEQQDTDFESTPVLSFSRGGGLRGK